MKDVICSDDMDKIQEQINGNENLDDQFDSKAPFTQNIEYQEEAEGNEDLHPDFSGTMTYRMMLEFLLCYQVMNH